MKTVFISIFQGVEARNILRTSILKTLLKDPQIRIVLFTRSREKADFYQKEFNDPRLIYEVAACPRPGGLDKFFAWLKFSLIKTETTDLKRAMAFEIRKNPLIYFLSKALNFIVARPAFRRLARLLDFLLVKNDFYAGYFEKYKPDLVFLPHLFDEEEIHILREAKKRDVKTLGMIYSWDKITSRCLIRLLPQKFVVVNNLVKDELIIHNDVKPENIFIGGVPTCDVYFNGETSNRADFFRRIGVDPSKKLILLGTMGKTFSNSDWQLIDFLRGLISGGKISGDCEILVRFLPYDILEEEELKKRPGLVYDYPGVRFDSRRLGGTEWDMGAPEINHLKDTLSQMSLLICYASSLSIEAAIFDKPVININFEFKKEKMAMKSPTQYFKTEHYKKAVATGGIKLVGSGEELIEWINKYLENPSLDKEGRKRLVWEQCPFKDGKSGERIANFILNQMNYPTAAELRGISSRV